MDNYPDDIGQYNWHPRSPFYEEPQEFELEPEPEYTADEAIDRIFE